jgi:hypothetical protein
VKLPFALSRWDANSDPRRCAASSSSASRRFRRPSAPSITPSDERASFSGMLHARFVLIVSPEMILAVRFERSFRPSSAFSALIVKVPITRIRSPHRTSWR